MVKSEFSESQFVIGYTRELFTPLNYLSQFNYRIKVPSTVAEKNSASDLIIDHYWNNFYNYSEFYQFKRSKLFNKQVFSDLAGKNIIDTSKSNKYGFNIYNSKKTKQFNVLQKLSKNRRNQVYYCAPLFHTLDEFNRYFAAGSILDNSKVFNFYRSGLNNLVIPPDSNHIIIFDRSTSYVCSEPIEITGSIASERNINQEDKDYVNNLNTKNIKEELSSIFNIIREEIRFQEIEIDMSDKGPNLFDINDLLMSCFDINWIPNFKLKQ